MNRRTFLTCTAAVLLAPAAAIPTQRHGVRVTWFDPQRDWAERVEVIDGTNVIEIMPLGVTTEAEANRMARYWFEKSLRGRM